jgi:hypothetical protein
MTNKKEALIFLTIIILLLIPFFVLTLFIHPSADDYGFTYLVKAFGRWGYQDFMYNNRQGRYFANFIFSYNPLTFNSFIGYKIFALFLLISFVLSLVFFIFVLLKNQSKTLLKVIFALLLILLFVNVIPSPPEAFYWITGSIEYFLPSIITFIFLSIIIIGIQKRNKKLINIITASFLGFCICGCNEINMIFILEILGLIILSNFKNHSVIKFILPIFLIIILSSLFDIIAPGNYIRMTNYPNANNIIYGFKEGIISIIKLFGIHIKSASFIIITILSLPILSSITQKKETPLVNINPWIACIIALCIFISLFFTVSYSTGLPSPLRIYNTTSVLFILVWFYLIYLFIFHYNIDILLPKLIQTLLIIACIIFFITDFYKEPGKNIYFSGNISKAYYDLTFNAKKYNDELNYRYEIINKNKVSGKLNITVPVLSVKPLSIHFIDILEDSASWINNGTAQYFGIKSIKIKK